MSTPWSERLLWLGVGIALTVVALMLWQSGEVTSDDRASSTHEQATSGEEAVSGKAASGKTASGKTASGKTVSGETVIDPLPECFLGVVLAREAVDVSSETDGLIEEIQARVGDRVERHQLIARLDTEVLDQQLVAERANLARVEAQSHGVEIEASQAAQEHERRQALSQAGLLSNEEKEAAGFDSEKAGAALEAARAEAAQVRSRIHQLETSLARTQIRAPFDGTVARRYLDAGSRARIGSPVVRLLSSGRLLARFAVPPESTPHLPLGTPVRVEIEVLGQAFAGVVEQVAPEIDAAAQMVFIEAQVDTKAAPESSMPEIPSGAVARVAVATPDQTLASCLR